jgi:hypothetical protein
MNSKRLFLKLAVLALALATLHVTAAPAKAYPDGCPIFARLCSTSTSDGQCGFQNYDCDVCYGNDGSVEDSADCEGF